MYTDNSPISLFDPFGTTVEYSYIDKNGGESEISRNEGNFYWDIVKELMNNSQLITMIISHIDKDDKYSLEICFSEQISLGGAYEMSINPSKSIIVVSAKYTSKDINNMPSYDRKLYNMNPKSTMAQSIGQQLAHELGHALYNHYDLFSNSKFKAMFNSKNIDSIYSSSPWNERFPLFLQNYSRMGISHWPKQYFRSKY